MKEIKSIKTERISEEEYEEEMHAIKRQKFMKAFAEGILAVMFAMAFWGSLLLTAAIVYEEYTYIGELIFEIIFSVVFGICSAHYVMTGKILPVDWTTLNRH